MSAATFRAHCAKGHDRLEFAGADGAKAFEAHMRDEHPTFGDEWVEDSLPLSWEVVA